jgi:hypothetical protein
VEPYKLPDGHVQGDKLPEPRGGWVNDFDDLWPNVGSINVKSPPTLQLPQPWWSSLVPEAADRKILLTHTETQRDERNRCRQNARMKRSKLKKLKKKNSMTLAGVTDQFSARAAPHSGRGL